MRTVKIIDTCTLINLFDGTDDDLVPLLGDYDLVTTDVVIMEYTRRFPRQIPNGLEVVGLDETQVCLMDELEFLYPNLAQGERSVMAMALTYAVKGSRVVVLTDDRKALRRMSEYSGLRSVNDLFPGADGIILGNRTDLRRHVLERQRS